MFMMIRSVLNTRGTYICIEKRSKSYDESSDGNESATARKDWMCDVSRMMEKGTRRDDVKKLFMERKRTILQKKFVCLKRDTDKRGSRMKNSFLYTLPKIVISGTQMSL